MKTKFYLQGKKITKKKAMELISSKQLKEAQQAFLEDPHEHLSWYTKEGMLVVEFGF